MPERATEPRIPCVGALVHDHDGRILLVRRARPPSAGLWSLPGGHVEPGEDDASAIVREVAEETGLQVRPGRLVGVVERKAPAGGVYVIRELACEVVGGFLRPGDDAADARWFSADDLRETETVPDLVEVLTDWELMPR